VFVQAVHAYKNIVFGEIVMMMLWEPGLWGNFMVAQHHTKQFFFPLLSIVGVLV